MDARWMCVAEYKPGGGSCSDALLCVGVSEVEAKGVVLIGLEVYD